MGVGGQVLRSLRQVICARRGRISRVEQAGEMRLRGCGKGRQHERMRRIPASQHRNGKCSSAHEQRSSRKGVGSARHTTGARVRGGPRVPCTLSRKAYGVKMFTLTAPSPPVFALPSDIGCPAASMAYIDSVLGMLGAVLERPKSAV